MKELIASINRIQSNTGNAEKTGKNTFGKGFDYSKESEILGYLKPLLKAEGIGYSFDINTSMSDIVEISSNKFDANLFGDLYIYKGDAQIKSGFIVSASNTDKAKAVGSAMTYMVRYVLAKAFGISTDKLDPDTTKNTTAVRTDPKAKTTQQEKPIVETVYNETPVEPKVPKRESIIKTFNKNIMTNTNFARYVTVVGIKETADFEKYTDTELLNILKEFK